MEMVEILVRLVSEQYGIYSKHTEVVFIVIKEYVIQRSDAAKDVFSIVFGKQR